MQLILAIFNTLDAWRVGLFDYYDANLLRLASVLVSVLVSALTILLFRHLQHTVQEDHPDWPIFRIELASLLLLFVFPGYFLIRNLKYLRSAESRSTDEASDHQKITTDIVVAEKIKAGAMSGVFRIVVTLFVWFPFWIGLGTLLSFMLFVTGKNVLGYQPVYFVIPGTGSMYPTFPKGHTDSNEAQKQEVVGYYPALPYPNGVQIKGRRFFERALQRGDIVTFENQVTQEVTERQYGEPGGFVKRIIGLPGDTIELREGNVWLNGQPLREPYTAKPHSTFGGQFLGECKQYTVPEGKLFVMGDNRKGSSDSREELGVIGLDDVDHVLTLAMQEGRYKKNWRDTAQDFNENTKIRLDADEYLRLLNQKRQEAGVKPLKFQSKLEQSAQLRGAAMLRTDDFSFEATRSGLTMKQAMNQVGYSNIVYGESNRQGYYEAEELIESQFEIEGGASFVLNKDYQEVGIAAIEGQLNSCPTQVIVMHFAGYVPPDYDAGFISSWDALLTRLKEIQSGWQSVKNFTEFYSAYQQPSDEINQIIQTRIDRISQIMVKVRANQWLSAEEEQWLKDDLNLSNRQSELSEYLLKEQKAFVEKLQSGN